MKSCNQKSVLLPVLVAVLFTVLPGRMTAQTFTVLHSFTKATNSISSPFVNSDGFEPFGGLILSGNTLYGTTTFGGIPGNGTVFAVNTDASGFTTLHSFTDMIPYFDSFGNPFYTNSDGGRPQGGLILLGNALYGTAAAGGSSGWGTIFTINTNGTGLTNLYNFAGGTREGAPLAGLILSGNTLYGTAEAGGSQDQGTVFKVNIDGTGFTTLHNFTGGSDGATPYGGLILSGNTLYGTTMLGGSSGNGTVFALNTDGTGFTNLHSFSTATGFSPLGQPINADGAHPQAGLILSGSVLYGTALFGGSSGNGTVFSVNTNSTGFTTLHSFTATSSPSYTNSDGANPYGGLILSGNTLYGSAGVGGRGGSGTVFVINIDGTGFTTLYSFTTRDTNTTTNRDGATPQGMILSGKTVYGTAAVGGTGGSGTIFSISLPPQLTINPSGANLIVSWPTNFTGFYLQDTVNLAVGGWITTTLPQPPIIMDGQFVVTVLKPSSGQHFYRLSQ